MTLEIIGKVIKAEDGTGFENFKIEIYAMDQLMFEGKVAEVFSRGDGEFRTTLDEKEIEQKFGEGFGIFLVVYNTINTLISDGRDDPQGKLKWNVKNLVMFDMTFPASAEQQKPPDFGALFKDI